MSHTKIALDTKAHRKHMHEHQTHERITRSIETMGPVLGLLQIIKKKTLKVFFYFALLVCIKFRTVPLCVPIDSSIIVLTFQLWAVFVLDDRSCSMIVCISSELIPKPAEIYAFDIGLDYSQFSLNRNEVINFPIQNPKRIRYGAALEANTILEIRRYAAMGCTR